MLNVEGLDDASNAKVVRRPICQLGIDAVMIFGDEE
jgi:hypothetical protein